MLDIYAIWNIVPRGLRGSISWNVDGGLPVFYASAPKRGGGAAAYLNRDRVS